MTESVKASSLVPVGVFTIAYLAIATVTAFARGNQEFIFYIVVVVLLVGAVLIVHRRVQLSQGVLWALSVWGLAHMMGGLVRVPEGWPINGDIRVLYSLWIIPNYLKYDHVVHAYGFGTTTWVCWQGLKSILRTYTTDPQPTFGLMVLSATAGLGFGALNEVVEFAAVLLVPETNVGGYINTGWDLVANSVGAATAALLILVFDRSKSVDSM
ncbi:MAG: DUF2238 domain-containing protein [Candidatus Hydrogenedentes bacterium]|nr:DUF2238 domain-containing protein [Candidatus Hydrogenedentota bacterium]